MTGVPSHDPAAAVTIEQLQNYLDGEAGARAGFAWRVEALTRGRACVRLPFDARAVRPGGIISGPTLFALADLALYVAVMSVVGFTPMTVTTEMTIHFLEAAPPGDLLAHAEVLRAGQKLVCGAAKIYGGDPDSQALVCHAVGTYAVPRMPRSPSVP
jgi:uncharacterized protein (TIGR00369 family)